MVAPLGGLTHRRGFSRIRPPPPPPSRSPLRHQQRCIHIEKGSQVESTHKVPTSHYHTKHCHSHSFTTHQHVSIQLTLSQHVQKSQTPNSFTTHQQVPVPPSRRTAHIQVKSSLVTRSLLQDAPILPQGDTATYQGRPLAFWSPVERVSCRPCRLPRCAVPARRYRSLFVLNMNT